MDPESRTPSWVLWPLPANAVYDPVRLSRIDELAADLPNSLATLHTELLEIRSDREYDTANNRAIAHVWAMIDSLMSSTDVEVRRTLFRFATAHMPPAVLARVCRRFVKDVDSNLRRAARQVVERGTIREVALPVDPDSAWDPSGWLRGSETGPLSRHRTGSKVRANLGLPDLKSVSDLRELLGIRSQKHLGFLLLATDLGDGPYTTFQIPKADGSARDIHAPKASLRWVLRGILDHILAKVPAHDAAHGFVSCRSTVTNAVPHLGSSVILKFDLTDFFPSIHYFRVVGLFASLGYHAGSVRFRALDRSRDLAPVMARLCCHVPDPKQFGGRLPQGAPTSPAISNLVCRRLDARLTGLAVRAGAVYTRYADDLTFSFKDPSGVNLGRFRWWVDQVCHQEGFFVNQKKFRVIRSSQRQLVTGLVVNDELRVPRDQRRRFRAILHNCRTHGVDSQARGNPKFAEWLRGFASYVHMVHPDEGVELLKQVDALLGSDTGGP